MSKEYVLAVLEGDINNPGSYKSGEYLEESVFRHSTEIIQTDRQGLVEALKEWIEAKEEPHTMLAVRIARRLRLMEMIPQIKDLRDEIARGGVFPKFYLRYIDEALNVLTE